MADTINTNVFESTKKFVDFAGLDYFWGKVKTYVDGVDTTLSQGVAANSANVAANSSAITKLQEDLAKLNGGEGSIANQIDAKIEALKLGETYETIANVAALKTELTEAIATAKSGAETTAAEALAGHAADGDLHVTKAKQEAWNAAAEAINAFLDENAVKEGVVDTLKEIQTLLAEGGETSETLLADVAQNKKDIAANSSAIGSVVTKMGEDIATALGTAATTAQTKADAAEAAAKAYADGLAVNYDAAGTGEAKANAALAAAKEYTDTAESNAKTYAEEKAAAAEAAAIAQAKLDAQEFLKGYYTKSETEGKIGESLATAKTHAEEKAAAAESNAKAYAKQYTDELYSSIQFASQGDIDGIFNKQA